MARDADELLRTPEEASRKCTDVGCLIFFGAILAGLVFCIHQSVQAGDIQRLQSLPDFQGTQCMEKFVFFPLESTGIDLHRQVCVDACPVSSAAVVTYLRSRRLGSLEDAIPLSGISETDSLLQPAPVETAAPAAAPAATLPPTTEAPVTTVPKVVVAPAPPAPAVPTAPAPQPQLQVVQGPSIPVSPVGGFQVATPAPTPASAADEQEVVVMGYPSFPLAGVLCVPNVRDFEGNITELTGKNLALQAALQVSELWHNQEVLLLAALVTVLLSLLFLCFVENCAKCLVNVSVTALIIVPATFGVYCLYKQHSTGAEVTEEVDKKIGIMSPEFAWTAAVCGILISVCMMICACCLCERCESAAHRVEEAAECLMTMPSLLLEPFFSFVVKVPVFVLGCLVFIMLVGSGEYDGSVDLTNPQSLFHPDSFSSISAIYFLFAWLLVMELLHYVSVFVVIYVAEVWFFKHFKQTARGAFCEMCGLWLLVKGFLAAMRHLGSLVFAAMCLALLRPIRWVVKAFLMAEEAASFTEVGTCILKAARWAVDACFGCLQKVLDVTSQIALMQMALDGNEGFCSSLEFAMEQVFREAAKWTSVEGLGAGFVVLGVGGISTGTGCLVWMVTISVPRYTEPSSAQYVSDPESTALASGLIALLMSLCFLHHFQTITDTIAFCRGLQDHASKYAEEPEDQGFCECWGKDSRETEKLLKK